MSAFKRINKADVFVLPYTANKYWNFDSSSLADNNVLIFTGVRDESLFDSNSDSQENGQYKKLIFNTINHLFYQEFSGSYLNTDSLSRSTNYESASIYRPSGSYFDYGYGSECSKYFPTGSNDTIKVISIPKKIYGNSIKKGTFCISSSVFQVIDDSHGNLVDMYTEPNTSVGNIFYSHGLMVITNVDYQSMFGDNYTSSGDFSSDFSNDFFI